VHAGRENLGVEYLLSVLRNHGFRAVSYNENLLKNDIKSVVSFADLIGFSLSFWEYREQDVNLIERVSKLTDAKIIAGGHSATIGAEYFLRKCQPLSGIVMGEGEETIIDVAKTFAKGANTSNLPGFYTREGFIKRQLGDINALPYPAKDELELILQQNRRIKEAYISTTRGCHNACAFCSIPSYYKLAHGPRWRERSVESVCCELEELLLKYPEIDSISFVDDNFLGFHQKHWKRGLSIAKRLHELNSQILFEITCRVDSVDYELLSKLSEYGLSGVYLGIESGVQRILDLFRKNTTVEKNIKAIETISRLGIGCDIGFIMFCPSISIDEVEANLFFLKAIIERCGVYVHPAAVFRNLKTYPTDLGISALESSDYNFGQVSEKIMSMYSAMNHVWKTFFEAEFLKLEYESIFIAAQKKTDISRSIEFTIKMIDIGLNIIKELRKHDNITEKELAMVTG
jgi:radical SAM superfamily enzyme YgiQ (UPF0313 family)